jgi:hypothetical protein
VTSVGDAEVTRRISLIAVCCADRPFLAHQRHRDNRPVAYPPLQVTPEREVVFGCAREVFEVHDGAIDDGAPGDRSSRQRHRLPVVERWRRSKPRGKPQLVIFDQHDRRLGGVA